MQQMTTTKISRSWGATIGYMVGAIVALGISILLFVYVADGPVTFGIALIPLIVAGLLVFASFGGSGVSTCPVCNASVGGLGTKANDGVLCAKCHNYLEGKDGTLWRTDPSRIAENTMFTSPMPENFQFPSGCCICGSPQSTREKISLRMQNASSVVTQSAIGMTTSTEVSVEVPHCSAHKGGASLTGTPKSPHIKFRSYPYLRAFCELNGTMPG